MKKIFVFCFLAYFSFNAVAQTATRTITVQGKGAEYVSCKYATINMAVITKNSSAKDAVRENAQKMANAQEALRKYGLDEKSFSTTNYSVYQEVDRVNGQELHLYRVSNSLIVKISTETNMGEILDCALEAGINEFSNIVFIPDNYDEALKKAQERAVANARQTAETFAKAAGAKVGKVVSISENYREMPRRFTYSNMEMAAPAAKDVSTSIIPGDTTISSNISVVFELE
ncbi:MAG: SIMPL domain-containing protein [Spirochaetaceae bacterium]|nr:SIMPL domain-containing protein [Spirochaetaceae bacterium]